MVRGQPWRQISRNDLSRCCVNHKNVDCESVYNTPELYEYEEGSTDLFASWMECQAKCVRDFRWPCGEGSDDISLKAMSKFEIYMFHGTGKPKESSFPIPLRKPAIKFYKLLQTKGTEKFQVRRGTKWRGRKGMTAAKLVKDETAQYLETSLARVRKYYLNSKRKKDVIRSKKALNSNCNSVNR